MDTQKLEFLGLTHNEALVYQALLGAGETKTGKLVRQTGLHRVVIYDALEMLIRKGLASYVIKENRKYFQPADPERLIDFLEEKKERARELLPELQTLRVGTAHSQRVSIYEGVIGLKSAMENMIRELSPGGLHYVFASGNMAPTMGPYYQIYQAKKKKNKISTRVIYDDSFRLQTDILRMTVGDIKFYALGPFPTDTWIYNDKVLIVTYTAKPAIAILIENQQTADSYKRIFEGFWKKAKR